MPYTSATNDEILNFLNRAQTKIGEVSILVADKVSEDARFETYRDEVEMAYGLLSFIRSLDNNFNDWTEAEIIQFIDKWTAKANLNDVPFYDHANFNERVTFTPRVVIYPDLNTRVRSTTSTATLTPNVSLYDKDDLTAQVGDLTIANPTGTPSNGNGYVIMIIGDGSAITFGNQYRAIGTALPSVAPANKTLYVAFMYNGFLDKYDVLPSQEEV